MHTSTRPVRRARAGIAVALTLTLGLAAPAVAAEVGPIDFENYALGPVWGQQGWTGGACGPHDIAVTDNTVNPAAPAAFGTRSLRISNATVDGCFNDAFSPSLADEAGEATADSGGLSGGTRQPLFVAQFTIASATGGLQPGLNVQVSPDRGDGARMSFVRIRDTQTARELEFYDVQGTDAPPPCLGCANFVSTALGTVDPATPHTIRIEMRLLDGPSNDVVRVFVDGQLRHTGGSWEDYYTMDTESSPTPPRVSRTVDSLLIRASGTPTPSTAGAGFIIDGLALHSGPLVPYLATQLKADPVVARLSPLSANVLVGLTATLTTGGRPLAGEPVAFVVGGKTVCTGTSANTGVAKCAGLLSNGQVLALLSLGYKATFAGDNTYLPSTGSAGLLG